MQCAKNKNRFDKLEGERRRDVVGNADKPQYLDAQLCLRLAYGLEIALGKLLEPQNERPLGDRLTKDSR